MSGIDTSTVNSDLILYLIIKGQFNEDQLPLDQLSDATATYYPTQPNYLRFNNYSGDYYINGISKIVTPNIKLTKATIHIIDVPYLEVYPLSPACSSLVLNCASETNWYNTTIAESIAALSSTGYSTFAGFLSKTQITFPTTYTIFVISDSAYEFGGSSLRDYLNSNVTALDKYLQKLYCTGTYYPNAAAAGDINLPAEDGTTFSFSKDSDTTIFLNTNSAEANVRNDGIFYLVTLDSADSLVHFDVPAAPVAPVTPPTAPIPSPIKPADSSSTRLNGIWFCLFFVIVAVLFLM